MKIQTRLIIYNLLIICISAFALMFIFGFIVHSLEKDRYKLSSIQVDENSIYIEDLLSNVSATDETSLDSLNNELNNYNYSLFVFVNNEMVYGENIIINRNISEFLNEISNSDNTTKTLFLDRTTIVARNIDDKILVSAYNISTELFLGRNISQYQVLLIKFLLISTLVLIFILFIAVFFSRKVIIRLMKPVDLLTMGAKRIQTGNLDEPLDYQNNDEFKIVCNNFDDMQLYLKEEKDKNRKFENSKMEMINGISHDIRTPLTSVKGYIKGIKDGVANTKEKQEQYLNIAYNKTIDIEDLLNKLFDTFNIETGTIDLNLEETNIKSFIDDYISKHKDEFNHKKVQVNVSSPSVDLFAFLDKQQMERVFNNLFENSLKYGDTKNMIVEISIWRENGEKHISYKDNGKGIKDKNLEHIFDEFWKEDTSRTGKNKGSGLGLYIIKQIIDAHNARIFVKNKKGLYFEMIFSGDDSNE